MSDAPPKLLPHYQHQPAQVKKQVLQGKNCFAILSFPRRSLCSLILQKWFSIVGAIFTLSEWGAYKVLILKKVPVQQHYRHTGKPQQLQKYKVAKTRDWKEETAAWMCSGTVSHSLSSLVPYTAKCRGKSKALIEQMVNILFYFLFSPVCSLRHCLLQTFQTRSE